MEIKKKCRVGAKWRARLDQNHQIFFTWPHDDTFSKILDLNVFKLSTII